MSAPTPDPRDATIAALRAEVERKDAALEEAILQIEYLHAKFGATGSGNTVLTRIRAALAEPPA